MIRGGSGAAGSGPDAKGWALAKRVAIALALMAGCSVARGREKPADSLSPLVIKADEYWLGRWNLNNVWAGLQFLQMDVKRTPSDYNGWWRIAKFYNFLGRHNHGDYKMHLLKKAMRAGRKAVALEPNRPEGHFWLGASEGLFADDATWFQGLRMIDKIRDEMEQVERIDPNYEQCSAQRTLARVDYRAPFFEGGDKNLAIQLLQNCLSRYPHDSLAMLYLADAYYSLGKTQQARQEYEQVMSLCPDPRYDPEEMDNKAEANLKLERRFGVHWSSEMASHQSKTGPKEASSLPMLESERR